MKVEHEPEYEATQLCLNFAWSDENLIVRERQPRESPEKR